MKSIAGSTPLPSPFVHRSLVHFDELDPMQMLHNVRLATHVERATIAFYASLGRRWERNVADNPDQFHVVRELQVDFLQPFLGTGEMHVEIWVERLGSSSCVYRFRCASADGRIVYARGRRAIVKVDPDSHRPLPWTPAFRDAHERLLQPTEAGA
jgi:acyl-CoA thioester hydrolase